MKPSDRLPIELEVPADARIVKLDTLTGVTGQCESGASFLVAYTFDADQRDELEPYVKRTPCSSLWLSSGYAIYTVALGEGFYVQSDFEQILLGEAIAAKWPPAKWLFKFDPPATCGPAALEGAELLCRTEGKLSPSDLACPDY